MSSSVATTITQPQLKQRIALAETAPARQEPASSTTKTKTQEDYDRFFWTYTEEPHKTRRQAIIKAHPEVDTPPMIGSKI